MKMKKLVSIAVIAMVSMAMVFAGGSPEVNGLVWSNWSGAEEGSKEAFEMMISTWNEDAGEEGQVTQINWPWGDTTTQALLRAQGSEQYDVVQLDIRMLPVLAEAGVLANLEDLFGSSFFNQFPAGSVSVGQFDGVQYAVPWTIAPIGMISNPKILAESGVNFEIETIADFERACEMVLNNHPQNTDSNQGNDIIPYAAMTKDAGTVAPDFMAWIWTFGGSVFANGTPNMTDANTIKALEWFKSMYDAGYIQEAMGRGDARTLYKEGRVAFYDDALLAKGAITNEAFGDIEVYAKPIARPVVKAGDSPKAVSWGHVLAVIDRSNNKEMAKEFIEHIISEEVALSYFDTNGMLPSKSDLLAKPVVANDYWSASWEPILDGGRLAESAGRKEAAYNQAISDNIQAILSGSKTVSKAAQDINAVLAE